MAFRELLTAFHLEEAGPMHFRTWLALVAVASVIAPAFAADPPPPATEPVPHWIWSHYAATGTYPPKAIERIRLQRVFRVEGPVQLAMLRLAADYCRATVEINDRPVLTIEPFSPTTDVDVTNALCTGENRITINAKSDGPGSAIALGLKLTAADGTPQTIVSDDQWQVGPGSAGKTAHAVSLGMVSKAMWGIGRRPATIDPFDNYEQWKQAGGDKATKDNSPSFWIAPGFEISLVRKAQPEEGSWVSMAFDSRGRLTIAREDKGLLRVGLPHPMKIPPTVETINDELLECRGLLYIDGSLFASANNSKGLYRLRDTDRDDKFDEVKLLREFPGSVGHGRNDIVTEMSPGRILAICGDSVDVLKTNIFDFTSPFREARRDQATREGFLVRTDQEGKEWQLICAGLRNPFGIASLGPSVGRFTYDADAEFDMGTPWYRPTRVLHLVAGADYGWRGVTGKWPPYFPDHPDNGSPMLDIGRGSPTAVAFADNARFPWEYRQALYVLDWTYGRILAVHRQFHGAGLRAHAETFLKGRPLNVTDLAIGHDGAMYIITGGRKTQSALYRITYVGQGTEEQEISRYPLVRRYHDGSEWGSRIILENAGISGAKGMASESWWALNSVDPVLRHAARVSVEHQPVAEWRNQALIENRPTAALTALMALARSGDKDSQPKIVQRLLTFKLQELDVSQTLILLHTYWLCLQQAPEAIATHKGAIIAQLDAVYPHPSGKWLHVGPLGMGNVQWQLARVLAELGSPTVVPKTCQTLLVSEKQEDRIMGLFVLRNVREGWTPELRRAYFTALNEGSSFVGGEGMPKFLAHLREDALATLTDSEKEALADLLKAGTPVDEPLPPARPVVKAWTSDDFSALLADATKSGDPARGATIYRDALCIRCHRVGARGPAVGPDLTNVASRFSRRDMLESILTPSKVVAENYRSVQVSTIDGRVHVGRVLIEGDYRSEKLRLVTDPLRPSQVVEIDKKEIEQYRESETSPMPKGLLDGFRPDEVLDLLAFLAADAKAQPTGK